jgi:hypothetical protein
MPGSMKKTALGVLVVIYFFGVMVTWGMLAFNSGYDCYRTQGVRGIFFCPEANRGSPFTAMVKSFSWPYYAYRALAS